MYATDHFETQFLNSMRGVTLQAPPQMYLALFLTNPTETGRAGTEISYDGYQRQPITFSAPAMSGNGMSIQNDAQIDFEPANVAAGTVAYLGIMDSLVGGNMWLYGKLNTPLTVIKDVGPSFPVGAVTYTSSGQLTNTYKTKLLNVMRGESITGHDTYLSLYNGDPENGGAELYGTEYSRPKVELTAPAEGGNGQMYIENSVAGSFNSPTTSWGTWAYTALFDAETGGQPVWKKQQTPSWELKAGRKPVLKQGALHITIN